jgi:hypothetical protein
MIAAKFAAINSLELNVCDRIYAFMVRVRVRLNPNPSF